MGVSNTSDRAPVVRLEVAGAVGTIVLDRPPVNALDAQAQAELHRVADEAAARTDVRAVVIAGAAGVFSAGADISEMVGMSADAMELQAPRLQAAFAAVAAIPKPVIAAIEGYALGGGCELALAADCRFMSTRAVIGLTELELGVIPAAGGTQRLARLLGTAAAKRLIFDSRRLNAHTALAVGLVDEVVAPGRARQAAHDWAAKMAAGPAAALAAAKAAIDLGASMPLNHALNLETRLFVDVFAGEDREIGMRAFLAGETPRFTGTTTPPPDGVR